MAHPGYVSAVYIDDRVQTERWVRRRSLDLTADPFAGAPDETATLKESVELLLGVCHQIYLCRSAKSFLATLADLNEQNENGSHCAPIFAFVDVVFDPEAPAGHGLQPRDSIASSHPASADAEDIHGVQLLAHVASDLQIQEDAKLTIPVAILRPAHHAVSKTSSTPHLHDCGKWTACMEAALARCVDAGAVDVLKHPVDRSRVQALTVHAYRVRRAAQKERNRFMGIKKSRKQSWVGVDSEPYAYLREAMVSKLMKSICNPEDVIDEFQDRELHVSDERRLLIDRKLGDWDFSAHDFSDDELMYAACAMLKHAMSVPEVAPWRLTDGELRIFLLASRAAYNSFVLYHNFRHAVDVLQSVFSMLLHIGALPPYGCIPSAPVSPSPIASLLTSFDALALLISAIGHDVGHPGVNNLFLTKLNAPLAQLYNDNSVLEAFHCAAFSQILRRHWPAAFRDTRLRKLLISSILATDMGVHFKFIERMAELQKKYRESSNVSDWSAQDQDNYRTLLCGLLIKCADISNVSRPWQIAERWTNILQEEFARQGEMEKEVGMETALFGGPPELGNLLKLATGQISFMAVFALPLFEGVAELCPQLSFAVQQIQSNRSIWQDLADREKRRSRPRDSRSSRPVSPEAGKHHAGPNKITIMVDESANKQGSPRRSLENGSSPQPSTGRVHPFSSRDSLPSIPRGGSLERRTQSASTDTRTVGTPASPVTKATSVVSLDDDSDDDAGDDEGCVFSSHSEVETSVDVSRPPSSDVYVVRGGQHGGGGGTSAYDGLATRRIDDDVTKSYHVMTAFVSSGLSSAGSSPVENDKSHIGREAATTTTTTTTRRARSTERAVSVARGLTRKKSRLRLAFWRRRPPTQMSN
ncbi:hypothetical protein VTN31DRAFT_1880 [Thermomyces dupontii]|uniref:uncharacterized protein n=1 Tax=Talaromyces thermophilus TaxID=28565 RepID=UPI0037449C78